MEGWLRVKQVQQFCNVSERTVHNWIRYEGLKYSKIRGTVLISVITLNEFLENRTVPDDIDLKVDSIIRDVLK